MKRKAPKRTCIACGSTDEKRELVRFVRAQDGTVACDPGGKKAGRGAYVCRDSACFERARSKHLFEARLRCSLSVEDYERLEQEFSVCCSDNAAPTR